MVVLKNPSYISPSSANSFDGCPLRWKFKYVDRLPDPSNQPALVGSFAHLILEKLYELAPQQRTKEQAKTLARELWDEFACDKNYQALELDDDQARLFRWQGWLAIEGIWKLEDPKAIEVISTEQKIDTHLDGVPFRGIVDRVERSERGALIVSDYKSGYLPHQMWRKDKILQVMLYAAALNEISDEQPAEARLLYLGKRTLDVKVTQPSMAEARKTIKKTWTEIETACDTQTFEAKAGVLCGWCAFIEQCPTGQKHLEERSAKGKLPAHAPNRRLIETTASV